jgi:bacillithiol biosynthesis cysteine-adding enzyme BshC
MQDLLANDLQEKFRRKDVLSFFQKHYAQATFQDATRAWVNELFGERGLVVIDGNHPKLKASFSSVMAKEITEQFVHREVNITNHHLHELGYEVAVTPRELNLFYLHDNKRVRLVKEGNHVRAFDDSFSAGIAETLDHLQAHPERFSPNVLLRPIYEEFILPSVCYIGGPGEMAYWLQLKSAFNAAEVPMPALLHRFSALWLKPKDVETLKKNELAFESLQQQVEEAKKEVIAKLSPRETQHERNVNSALFESLRHYAKSFDDTLVPFLNAEEKRQQDQWKAIEAKFKKSLKQKEEVRLNQIEKVFQFARPENTPQERVHSLMYALEIFGFDALLKVWDNEDPFTPAFRIMEIAPSTFAE